MGDRKKRRGTVGGHLMRPRPGIGWISLAGALALIASGVTVVRGERPSAAPAQSAAGAYVPRQNDRPTPADGDEPGFESIFDGRTLTGWDGNPTYWRAESGTLVGEITPETVIKSNTFVVWRGGTPRDFELKLDYRITAGGNSGINYRSAIVPDTVTPANRHAIREEQPALLFIVGAGIARGAVQRALIAAVG